MGKFLVLAGGIVAGGGFVTGVAGLTVLGMTDSESDIIRKRMEIDKDKLVYQGKIIETEKAIKVLEASKDKIDKQIKDLEKKRDQRIKNNNDFKTHIQKKLEELKTHLEKPDGECKELNLEDFVKDGENSSWKEEEWFKGIVNEFKGKTRFGAQCKEII